MKIHGFLRPFMHALFQDRPDITTPEAVAEMRDFLSRQSEGDQHYDEAADIGFAAVWGNFTGGLRQKAQKMIKTASISVSQEGITITTLETMKLPIPDGDLSPTYADSTALMLRQSIRFMLTQTRGLERQIALAQRFADLLDAAVESSGEPDLTLREAFGRGLITWEMVEAA